MPKDALPTPTPLDVVREIAARFVKVPPVEEMPFGRDNYRELAVRLLLVRMLSETYSAEPILDVLSAYAALEAAEMRGCYEYIDHAFCDLEGAVERFSEAMADLRSQYDEGHEERMQGRRR